ALNITIGVVLAVLLFNLAKTLLKSSK
ncbi:MAG: hypothetical protein ACI89M_001738, partial [Chitinophagales bacterium]